MTNTATAVQPLVKGDYVTLIKDGIFPSAGGTRGARQLTTKQRFKITREYTDTFIIKRVDHTQYYGPNSFTVPKAKVVAAGPPVDLSKPPAGSIAQDDPGLEWLWERAAEVAKEMGLCSDYDKIVNKLGIPGRERQITVKIDVNGLEVAAKVKARSKPEAEKLLRAKLGV